MGLIYNVHYEVAATAFLAVFYVFLKLQYGSESKLNTVFQLLVMIAILANVLDIISAFAISNGEVLPLWFNWLINSLYYLSDALFGFKFAEYIYLYTHRTKKSNTKYLRINKFLFGLYIVTMVANLFGGFLFNVSESGDYSHGNLYILVYVMPFYYYICSFISLITEFKNFALKQRISILVYFVVGLAGAFMQMFFFPNVLLSVFTIDLGIVMMFFSMESPDYQKLIYTMKELDKTKQEAELAREAASSANNAKSVFLARMSHEIRTPINSVLGMSELLLRDDLTSGQRQMTKNIQSAGNALLSIVNDILDFSKIESGKMDIVNVEYSLGSLLNDCLSMISLRASEKGLALRAINDPSIPEHLYGDEVRVRQIITNILTNAVKYTHTGYIALGVGWEDKGGDEMILKVSVEDTGIGIAPENMDKIFNSFQRIDERTNRNIEGSGLGLSITKQLLELMNGSIRIESTVGKGSTFFVKLPQKIVSREKLGVFCIKSDEIKADKYIARFEAPDAHILVVDDVEMNIEVVTGLLRETKIKVDTALGGKKALKMACDKVYDVILMDHMMPEMDGVETLNALRRIQSPNQDTPVIVLTANALVGAKEQYIKEGFEDYLSKPMRGDALEKMLLKYIPADKVKKTESVTDKISEEPQKNSNSEMDFTFVDRELGISYLAGNEELYDEITKMFCDDDKSHEIQDFLEKNDWKNYEISVHGLKSTSMSIGATVLAEEARLLEMAAKNNDIEYIKNNNQRVMSGYLELIKKLNTPCA